MLYDHYELKIIKIAGVLKRLMRHLLMIVVITSSVVLVSTALLATKGMVMGADSCPDSIVYGENLGYTAKAFLGKVTYEYRAVDGKWSDEVPTTVGEYEVRACSVSSFGKPRYGKVQQFSILPKEVTVTVEQSTVAYGDAITITAELCEGDVIRCDEYLYADESHNELWEAGVAEIIPDLDTISIVDPNGEDRKGNYKLTAQAKNVTLVARPITLETFGAQKEYDGLALSRQEYELTQGSLVKDDELRVVLDATITDAGTVSNEPQITVINHRGEDVTALYEITTVVGTLSIMPRPLTVMSQDVSYVYDGQPHENTEYILTGETVEGETLTVTEAPSLLDVEKKTNTLTFAVLNAEGEDKTANYTIDASFGTIEVTPRKLTLSTPNGSWIYDATLHSAQTLNVLNTDPNEGVAATQTLKSTDWRSIVNVGEVANECSYTIVDADQNVIPMSNYEIIVEFGMLTVTPRKVTIETSSRSWVYDATVHDCKEFRVTNTAENEGLVASHRIEPEVWDSITNVGTLTNSLTYRIVDGAGHPIHMDNYQVTTSFGTLAVTPRPLTIVTDSQSWVYDGQLHTQKTYTMSALTEQEGLLSVHRIVILGWSEIKAVGETENRFEYLICDEQNNSIDSNNYDITLTCGILTVTSRPITIATSTETWVYDGIAHSATVPMLTSGTLADGQQLQIKESASLKNHGTLENRVVYDVYDGEECVSDNYVITYTYGTLTVTKRQIAVTTQTRTWMYDGNPHDATVPTLTSGTLADGQQLQAKESASLKNYGTLENRVIYDVYDGEECVSDNYVITYTYGTLTVTKRPITVTSATHTWTYDGQTHSDVSYTVGGSGLADLHTLSVDTWTELLNVEAKDNEISVRVLDENREDATSNYEITYVKGRLEIKKRPIKLITASAQKVYDGMPLTNPSVAVVADTRTEYGLVNGHAVVLNVTGTLTNVGTAENTFDGILKIVIAQTNADVTANYEIESVTKGSLKVTPRPLTITTESKSWVYDGSAHSHERYTTNSGVDVGLAPGQTLTVSGWATITNVVESVKENSFTYAIKSGSAVIDLRNYQITEEWGGLTITPRPLTITTDSKSWVYDGSAHSYESYTTNSGADVGLAPGQSLTVSGWATITNVVESVKDNSFTYAIKSGSMVIDLRNYQITEEWGGLTITPRPLTITTGSKSWVYDGAEHYLKSFTNTSFATGVGLVSGHRIVVVPTSSWATITDVGSCPNSFTYQIRNGSVVIDLQNYEITERWGTLTVTPRPLTITTGSKSWVYDGSAHSYESYSLNSGTNQGVAPGQTLVISNWATITDVGSCPNSFDYVISDGNTQIDLNNYEITEVWGTLTVTKRKLTIMTGSKSWVYDGTEHSHEVYSILNTASNEGLAPDQTLLPTSFEKIFNVGTKENTFTFVIRNDAGETVNPNNYDITWQKGILEITPRPITVQTGSKTWEYDGNAHFFREFTVLNTDPDEGLATGQRLVVQNSTNIQDVGTASNEFLQFLIMDSELADQQSNYLITWVNGTLTILEADPPEGGEDGDGGEGGDGGQGGEGGEGNLDLTGSLGGGGGTGGSGNTEPVVVYEIYSEHSDTLYFKVKSFGNYTGTGWTDAEAYETLIFSNYPASYLTSLILYNNGKIPYSITVTPKGTREFILPYFPLGGTYLIPTDDTYYSGKLSDPYQIEYYDWDGSGNLALPEQLRAYERDYADFVKRNYLYVDAETLELMRQIIAEEGFSTSDPELIDKVARYIQTAATYNLDYPAEMDSEENQIVAFLTVYKEGVCRHYASAATVLFRALGIPARYTVGYVGETVANETTEITTKQAHAWVEVYLDGIGWIPVEVTGSGSGSDDGGEDDFEFVDPPMPTLTITPEYQYKIFDGTPLVALNEIVLTFELEELLALGYTYDVVVSGERTAIGLSTSTVVSFTLYDPDGVDVTDQFEIEYETGTLEIRMEFIKIYLGELQKYYDGTELRYGNEEDLDYAIIEIGNGFVLTDVQIHISMTEYGMLTAKQINNNIGEYISYRVLYNGEDVTESVGLMIVNLNGTDEDYVAIRVDKRVIELTSQSAIKEYDGEPLSEDGWYISHGSLSAGHRIYVEMQSSITEVGTIKNEISRCAIVDANGNSVSKNYIVRKAEGTLTVTEAQ